MNNCEFLCHRVHRCITTEVTSAQNCASVSQTRPLSVDLCPVLKDFSVRIEAKSTVRTSLLLHVNIKSPFTPSASTSVYVRRATRVYGRRRTSTPISSNSTGTSFPVTSSRTCWRRRQLPCNKLATSYEEVSDMPDHLDMSRWSESRQLPRNFLVTSWRLPRNIC